MALHVLKRLSLLRAGLFGEFVETCFQRLRDGAHADKGRVEVACRAPLEALITPEGHASALGCFFLGKPPCNAGFANPKAQNSEQGVDRHLVIMASGIAVLNATGGELASGQNWQLTMKTSNGGAGYE